MLSQKHVFQLAGGTFALGLLVASTPAQALTLTFFDGFTVTVNDGDAADESALTNGVQFSFNRTVTDSFGNQATVQGKVQSYSGPDAMLSNSGTQLNGTMLNLTDFVMTSLVDPNNEVAGNGGIFQVDGPFLTFEEDFNDFSYGTFFVAQQNLVGDFLSNGANNVSSQNVVQFSGNLTGETGGGFNLSNLSSAPTTNDPVSNFFRNGFAAEDTTLGQADNPIISGSLGDLKLAAGETLSLPSSAKICVAAEEGNDFASKEELFVNFSSQTAEDSCVLPSDAESTPEPASALGLMVLGALGTGSWLKRRQR